MSRVNTHKRLHTRVSKKLLYLSGFHERRRLCFSIKIVEQKGASNISRSKVLSRGSMDPLSTTFSHQVLHHLATRWQVNNTPTANSVSKRRWQYDLPFASRYRDFFNYFLEIETVSCARVSTFARDPIPAEKENVDNGYDRTQRRSSRLRNSVTIQLIQFVQAI